MSNELALLALLIIYSKSDGRFNLPFVICAYYVAYITMESYPLTVTEQGAWLEFYLRQSALDVLIILACCYLSAFYQRFNKLALCYAVAVGTSQIAQLLMIFNPTQFIGVHELRQAVAVPLDLIFALLGSGLGVHLLRFANRIRAAYNQLYSDSNNSGEDK
jgi:hypothetical protein